MDEIEKLAVATETVNRRLGELIEELGQSASPVAEVRRIAWAAGEPADVMLVGLRAGVVVFNQTAADLFVGFSPGSGDAANCRFTIAAKHYLVLPIETAFVSIGAAAAASTTLVELERPLPFSGGAY